MNVSVPSSFMKLICYANVQISSQEILSHKHIAENQEYKHARKSSRLCKYVVIPHLHVA